MKSSVVLVTFFLLAFPYQSCGQGVITLAKTNYVVTEGDRSQGYMFQVLVRKSGVASSSINVVVEILNPGLRGGNDFIGSSKTVRFFGGRSERVELVDFTVNNDDLAEPDETFEIVVKVTNGDGVVGTPSRGFVTITANDDAYGIFSFEVPLLNIVAESRATLPNVASFSIRRKQGIFGEVQVFYQITRDVGDAPVTDDLSPASGVVLLENQKTRAQINILILPDEIPENDEVFNIRLTGAALMGDIAVPEGGPRVEGPTATLTILQNDAPIRFAEVEDQTDELLRDHIINAVIYRGYEEDTSLPIGGITQAATVNYFFVSKTATAGLDFFGVNGTLGFGPTEDRANITVRILSDDIPENIEMFEIHLANPSDNAVLIEPSVMRIIIKPNDEPNGIIRIKDSGDINQIFTIDEDETGQYSGLMITRGAGRFGRVTVNWTLSRLDSDEDVLTDLTPSAGMLVFEDGIRDVAAVFTVVGDKNLEPSERFRFDLLPETLQGGARVNGVTSATVILEDSDDIYGIVDLGGENLQMFEATSFPRALEITLVRTGGSEGDIRVQYRAEYMMDDLVTTDPFVQRMPAVTVIEENKFSQRLSLSIKSEAFLQFGAVFRITLEEVELVEQPPFGAYNSPHLGLSRVLDIGISEDAANGVIGFEDTSTRKVLEPDVSVVESLLVALVVRRDGTNGRAIINWELTGVGPNAAKVTPDDTGPTSGRVIMESGMDTVPIDILIRPDDIPETDEMIEVRLVRVLPENTQRIRPDADRVQLLIQENDMPGGVFEFSLSMAAAYEVEEEGAAIDITVVRYGGSLTERYIKLIIQPAGEVEFYGATSVMRFEPGETIKNTSIIAKRDNISELEEHFQLKLVRYDDNPAVIGRKSTINVTVLENDYPYGVVHFSHDNVMLRLEERSPSLARRDWVNVTVVRSRGLYGRITVNWQLVDMDQITDIGPKKGRLTFGPGESEAHFRISSIADDFPESAELFYINLTDVTGGAVIGEPRMANITVTENDHPIFFKAPSVVKVEEGGQVILTVARSDNLDVIVKVSVRTEDDVAQAADYDYNPLIQELTFLEGVSERQIVISTINDTKPETDESFKVILYNPRGDVSVYGGSNATVIIEANDDANGIFHFKPPFTKTGREGEPIEFELTREGGIFSEVEVHWEVLYEDTLLLAEDDFTPARGQVVFPDLAQVSPLIITPAADSIPEYEERFIIRLTQVTGGGPSGQVGKLAADDLEVELVVLVNDDPSGVFIFAPESREVSVPEDVQLAQMAARLVRLDVQRSQGTVGSVEVAWEIFSYEMASAGMLPSMHDLLFLGDFPPAVIDVPEQRRPETGSLVLSFTGCETCWGMVPAESQLPVDTVENGFSVSVWVRPAVNTDGYILAKTSPDGSRHYYALKLTTSSTSMSLEFRYSLPNNPNNQAVARALNINLQDGLWHHLLVTIDSARVEFFVDGEATTSSPIAEETTLDEPGLLTVAAIGPLGAERYTGLMQDLRLFVRKLVNGEIQELFNTPARKDVRPISGTLRYPDGDALQALAVFSKDDQEEEVNERFAVRLISARGGARVSDEHAIAELTVLKSDNANGLFGLSGPCFAESLEEEDTLWSCPVYRSRGDADVVTLHWQLLGPIYFPEIEDYDYDDLPLAYDNFVNATGTVIFQGGQREGDILFKGLDDDIPERAHIFNLELISAESSDGVVGSTPTSGASIQPDAATQDIQVPDNDYPYGLLEFSTGDPPQNGDPRIPPSEEGKLVRVAEEAGSVRLMVVRAQGLEGDVTVEWRTLDGTALSSGKTPPDYIARVDRLTFAPGQRYAYIEVTIRDNSIPENVKSFEVELVNPRGGAAVGLGSRIVVEIEHSDQAYGVFQFDDASLVVMTTEHDPIGGGDNDVRLRVVRMGGSIMPVTVSWAAILDDVNDLEVTSGDLTIEQGQTEVILDLKIRDDTKPELEEIILVQLTNSSLGAIGGQAVARVVVAANDDPYGVYIISQTDRPIRRAEANTVVPITVNRKELSGMFGLVNITWRTLVPGEVYPYLPGGIVRAQQADFLATSGWVVLEPSQVEVTFNVSINDDDEPEIEESVFVILTDAQLVRGEQEMEVTDSPSLGPVVETYAHIVIEENDSPAGVLQLSASEVTVEEDQQVPVLYINRSAGAFGQVSVKFEVVALSATYGLDYSITSTDVVLASGERRKRIPIDVINDQTPELEEAFRVRLLSVLTGGATLGPLRQARVIIAASDDPYGAFAFEVTQTNVDEPDEQGQRAVSLSVIRRGGTVGVVTVDWQSTLGGEEPSDDISPTSGAIFFISGQTHQDVIINILPDNVPEGIESIVITLVSASNGGRIDTDQHQSFISILANDNPHGVIEFSEDVITVREPDVDGPQYVEVSRAGGTYGQVRVFYNAFEYDLLTLGLEREESIFSYYGPPVNGKVILPSAATSYNVQGLPNPLIACATFCLMSEACMSFDFNATGPDCNWFTIADDSHVQPRPGVTYYQSDNAKKTALFAMRASPGVDYVPVTDSSVIINDGATIGVLPVSIRADAIPELPEIFQIRITRVELVGGPPRNPSNIPRLGDRSTATVSIAKNDNANGVFRIYSNDPRAMAGGQTVMLEEREKFSVELIVEREGGTIGEVFVTWSVDLDKSSATRGFDFIADGATLRFAPGDTQKTLTIGIEDDDIPENDETIEIELHDADGGATIGPDDSVSVVIQANDNVAGRLYFATTSYLVKEGELLTLTIERSEPALGQVTVDWSITTTNSQPPQMRFDITEGTLIFLPGENVKLVNVQVIRDDQPKVNQEYSLQLSNVRTDGVRDTGSAGVDPQKSVAIVTIEGGNEPHGIFSFSTGSQHLRVSEGDRTAELTLDRKFGVIGSVRVYYEVKVGSVSRVSSDLEAAIPMSDFVPVVSDYIVVPPGEASGTIPVQLYDDDTPEVDEAFLVNITGVVLEDPVNSGFIPKLAQSGTTAEVIIEANDGTFGEVVFSFQSQRLFIEEETLNLTLAILREKGAFGEVSIFCFAQSIVGGAIRKDDFDFEPREITFLAGETVKYVVVAVYDDDEPEPNEMLEILLASPKGGLTIGSPDRAVITLLASDRASGVVTFDASETIYANEPTALNTAQSKVELRLTRAPGVFGVVNVPYEIRTEDRSTNVTDLTPTNGYVRFNDREGEVTLEITVVGDDEPEEAETFILTLLPPDEASLGLITQRTIVIERNDAPYGLVQIYPAGTRNRSMTVEEVNRVLYFDVVRSQGSLDEVSVDMVTRSITAHSQVGRDVYLAPLQQLNVRDMTGWGSYEKDGDTYLVLLYQHQRAPLLTPVGSTGEGLPINLANITQSALFRWQGAPVLVQSIETDGASSATSFVIEGSVYLFITNKGGKTRHEAKSRLYKVTLNGGLQVIQDLRTSGATDAVFFSRDTSHYLVVTNERDNAGRTNINSEVYEWDFFTQRFSTSPIQYIPTRGAAAAEVTEVDDVLFLAIANGEDSTANTYELNSLIYRLDANNRFTIHQQIPTKGAADVTSFNIGSDSYLVLANSRDDNNRYHQMAVIYVWNRVTQLFTQVQELAVASVGAVQSFTTQDGRVHLSLAMEKTPSAIFTWDDNVGLFNQSWFGSPLKDLYPVTVNQRAGPLVLLAEARPVNESSISTVNIYQLALVDLGESDYVHRALSLTFKPGQTLLRTSAVLLQDDVPEDTEGFALELVEPRGGSELGASKEVVINILSNDNGHGVLEFAEDSLERYEEEIPSRDSLVQLNVVRRMGTYGRVVVRWRAEGDHNDIHDISPTSGQLEFGDGQAVASITLTIKDDQVSELDELTRIMLVDVLESGTPIPGRGATIGEKSTARVTVIANDSPYGVVSWEKSAYITTEPVGTDTTTMIHLIRSQGSRGTIRIGYITSRDQSLPAKERAVSGQDYVSIQSSVEMTDGVTRVPVEVTILADNDPEVAETFVVNITGVQLVGGAVIVGAGASVRRPGNVASITIAENDNARGIIQFDVNRNVEGRVDTYEGAGTLQLSMVRTIGSFGEVQVAWQASPREATTEDFSPAGGTVVFAEAQTEAFLDIRITDDGLSEELETFDVQLIRVTSGGGTLGSDNSVRVGIIRSDSPNGIFSFVQTRKTVRESDTSSDPDGVVTFDVQREGTDGVVNLQWRLSADAVDDFEPPLTGSLIFGPGEAYKRLTLRTREDEELEGEEEFTLSLVSANNNADISPTHGDATVVILPNSGAGGIISIAPQSRYLLMGEPTVTYDGRAEIVVERKVGTFGEVRVSWQITRRNLDTFVQHQDTVIIADLQQEAIIVIQTKDDNTPELQQTFTLEITAATGGATVDPLGRTAEITVVASDFPHGLFEFSVPQEITVSEDAIQVTIPVLRNQGNAGLVRVEYETSPGTAYSDETLTPDFRSSRGWLVFSNNQMRQTISIEIVNDGRAEGPEAFYVNLTRIQLQEPSNNNYTMVNGLQLDMPPQIGGLDYKTVIIDKNDNAEGIVQFAPEASAFAVSEEDGIARIPVVRGPGTFGEVKVKYTSRNRTASVGEDYLLPDGELTLSSGMENNTINVTIIDDVFREFAEQFQIRLTEVTGGALLGARTTAVVTITKSDYPNGKFSFIGQSIVSIPNPAVQRSLVLYVERSGGLRGRQTVHWRMMGPNNPNRVLEETNDISSPAPNGGQVTSGILQWEANEDGAKSFVINIKPHTGWETEKIFNVVLYDIQGFPAGMGNGEASVTGNNFTTIIQKYGHPNGIVRFDGVAQQQRILQEPPVGKRLVRFPIYRREGTVGSIRVNWQVLNRGVSSENNVTGDVEPASGTAIIEGDKRSGEIQMSIVSDGEPELNEAFTMHLISAEGGAEIDTDYSTSSFTVQYNGYPHGRFSVDPEAQTVVVSSSLQRSVRLNITRHDGLVGRVRVTYTIVYDQAQSGISYIPSAGAVTFEGGSRLGIELVDIENSVNIAPGSSFTVTLTDAVFIGVGVTMQPQLIAGKTTARIVVPPEAANSEVGFKYETLAVEEVSNLVDVVVERRGTYGNLEVSWLTGYPENASPEGFSTGKLSEDSGRVSLPNTDNSTAFKIQVSPRPNIPELFAMHLPSRPVSQTLAGAKLWAGQTLTRIEPHGVVRFDPGSREVRTQEPEDLQREVTLDIERIYGSLGNIQIRYSTYSASATGGVDYKEIKNGAVNMNSRQTRSTIYIQILSDTLPEEDEHFYVNFTSVTRLPTGPDQEISPRLSTLYSSARVTISKNNDPYGVVSVVVNTRETDGKATEPGSVDITVIRTGGTFGRISVLVRTIGGGEPWDTHVGVNPGTTNETISEVLGNRDISQRAVRGQDYQVIDQTLTFEEGQTDAKLVVRILDDTSAEDDEVFFVYLVPQTEGVRVAEPAKDNDRRGFASITIRKNDFWNGWIGFSKTNSTAVTGDEDSGQPITLTIERLNASFDALSVTWRARLTKFNEEYKSDKLDLTKELTRVTYVVDCPAGPRFCLFDVPLQNDLDPENQTSFIVELVSVGDGAQIDPSRKFANITLLPSDNPSGLVEFAPSSRVTYVDKTSTSVRLTIVRTGFREKRVTVRVSTMELLGPSPSNIASVFIYHALDGADFNSFQEQLVFEPGERTKTISIVLDRSKASDNPYPKMFRVALSDVTNGAVLGVDRANITIVDVRDLPYWDIWSRAQHDLTNSSIDSLMRDLGEVVKETLTDDQLNIVRDNLEQVVDVAETQGLMQGSRISIMSVFCELLDPSRTDAARGQWQLSHLLERFAYSYLVEFDCDQCCTSTTLIYSPSCPHVRFAVAKWYPEDINGYKYQGQLDDYFLVPDNLLRVQDNGRSSPNPKCEAIVFVEYSSGIWFFRGTGAVLLNDRVLTASVRGQASRSLSQPATFKIHTADRSIVAQKAECAFFDENLQQWTDRECSVINNLQLAIDDFVHCSCTHMSSYAVISRVKDPNYIGYPVWFHISCFIAMAGLALTILSHHICIRQAMFSANLIMHMCFAVFATELCYVIDAYLSPGHLLDIGPEDNNYRCIVMSIMLHYFFLAQFLWMMTQAINYWKILVLNDEHTERKYVLYFLLGWGLPGLVVFLFCLLTYIVYHYGTDFLDDRFYGDVNSNEEICFIVNPYTALCGVIVPALICLMVVGIVFIQAFQVTPQWQAYDDIYRERFNVHEIRALLLFWAIIILTWLWGGLHMAYGQLWMLILFCIFNVAIGIYAFVVYAVLRNPCAPCFKPQKATYAINFNGGSDIGEPVYPVHVPSVPNSIKGSRASLINDAWEKESVANGSHLKVKRSAANGNVYVVPAPPSYDTKPVPSQRGEDHDSQDFDDLIFALKTGGGYTPSESSHPPNNPNDVPDPDANYEMRRISIADTHL